MTFITVVHNAPTTINVFTIVIIITASESAQHQRVNEEELYDVDDHASQRYLKRSQMRVHAEYMHELQETIKCQPKN